MLCGKRMYPIFVASSYEVVLLCEPELDVETKVELEAKENLESKADSADYPISISL